MSSFKDRVPVVLYLIYLVARYGLKGAEKKVAEEYHEELMRVKELQNVSKHNKET